MHSDSVVIYPALVNRFWRSRGLLVLVLFLSYFILNYDAQTIQLNSIKVLGIILLLPIGFILSYLFSYVERIQNKIVITHDAIEYQRIFRTALKIDRIQSFHLEVAKQDRNKPGISNSNTKLLWYTFLIDWLYVKYKYARHQRLVLQGYDNKIIDTITITDLDNESIELLTQTLMNRINNRGMPQNKLSSEQR